MSCLRSLSVVCSCLLLVSRKIVREFEFGSACSYVVIIPVCRVALYGTRERESHVRTHTSQHDLFGSLFVCLFLFTILMPDTMASNPHLIFSVCSTCRHVESDKAFERRFQPVYVNEPSVETTVSILRGMS